jgi:hypothetical protein
MLRRVDAEDEGDLGLPFSGEGERDKLLGRGGRAALANRSILSSISRAATRRRSSAAVPLGEGELD